MDQRPVGFLDSGVGGLSLVEATRRLLPQEQFVFLADGRCFPYGELSPDEICARATQLCAFLLDRNVKLVVVACNTASVHALSHLRAVYPGMPFVGVVPVVKTLAQRTQSGTIAILSTPSTADSRYLAALLSEFAADKTVVNIPCPGLAESIESGAIDSNETRSMLRAYLSDVRPSRADVLGLGCTHYTFLRPAIKRILGSGVRVFDPSRPVARRIRQVLQQQDALASSPSDRDAYYTTGDSEKFETVAARLLREPLPGASVAHI